MRILGLMVVVAGLTGGFDAVERAASYGVFRPPDVFGA